MNTPIRHGEILLVPIPAEELPKRVSTGSSSVIVGHSETGHHHVLESDTEFEVFTEADEMFLNLVSSGTLVHQKATDRHMDLTVPAGTWKVVKKNEFDPFRNITRRVVD